MFTRVAPQSELATLKDEHAEDMLKVQEAVKQEVAEAKGKGDKAVEQMRCDMKQTAEEQFAVASKHYHKLQSDFSALQGELAESKKNLEAKETEAGTIREEMQRLEDMGKGELAKIKVELATAENEIATTSVELRKAREETSSFHRRMAALETEKQNALISLGTAISEKEANAKECQELEKVCSEMMEEMEAMQK